MALQQRVDSLDPGQIVGRDAPGIVISNADLHRAVDIAPLRVMEEILTDQGNTRHETECGDEGTKLERALDPIAVSRPIRMPPEQFIDLFFRELNAGHGRDCATARGA